MKAEITYFKPTGKYYTSSYCRVNTASFWDGISELRSLIKKQCPGLASGSWDGPIMVTFDCSSVPHILQR